MALGVTILRFVDENNVVRLDLNSITGWYLSRGLDIGRKAFQKTYIHQPGFEGVTFVSGDADLVTMRIPLLMHRQAQSTALLQVTAMQTLMNGLRTELERDTNILEYRPPDFATSFFLDTYKSDVPSLLQGAFTPSPFLLRQTGLPIVLEIDRAPTMRGAGAHI